MICNIHLLNEKFIFPHFFSKVYPPFKKWDLEFYPNKNGPVEFLKYYEAIFKNLKIRITPRGLEIYNSLHKSYHGNNHCDFTLKQLKELIGRICKKFDSQPFNFKVLSFEFGLNLITLLDIEDFIRCILNYKTKGMEVMRKSNKTFGVKIALDQVEFKIYSKTLERKFHDVL